ncbi:molecular chaperone [Mariprofundus erugo]|uniref:Molecular chaperone n=1 Tax=Mariprofundus erugo TaxID=2528639 RepID=A0A5R9GPT7_9PROT|nr:Hsp33 family molecular chaperone HslO [Mariprofundus erugo]TLS67608.1 molecular chaperone [Mariprofundus erugo]
MAHPSQLTTASDPTEQAGDQLIRFLLPDAFTRGAIIRGKQIIETAASMHRLDAADGLLFGQALLSSILLLSISKGGVRQVLQLDATVKSASWQRLLAETRPGAVRGYINRNDSNAEPDAPSLAARMGSTIRLSTVRDPGFGQPYISTVEHDSPYLADHIVRYLAQSVQIRADIVLHDDLAIMIEAMPGCDEEHWFKAVEALAKIPASAMAEQTPEALLAYFDSLHCRQAGSDNYSYRCGCSPAMMAESLRAIPAEQLDELVDASGHITVTCQYCGNHYAVAHSVTPSRLQ